MPRKQLDEESIYGLAADAPGRKGPQVIKYDAPAPAHAPKVKMHVDSSQVHAFRNPRPTWAGLSFLAQQQAESFMGPMADYHGLRKGSPSLS
jgi:hypothetical protein